MTPKTIKPVPWIVFSAKRFLDSLIKKSAMCFEWGSGGSTLYFAAKAKKIFSVEHDPDWFAQVTKILQRKKPSSYNLKLVPAEKESFLTALVNFSGRYHSTDAHLLKLSLKSYCQEISGFPDNYFDIVFVDGRARKSCIALAVSKVRLGGWLILDNSDRPEYNAGTKLLANWTRRDFYGHGPLTDQKWQTSFFQKTNNHV